MFVSVALLPQPVGGHERVVCQAEEVYSRQQQVVRDLVRMLDRATEPPESKPGMAACRVDDRLSMRLRPASLQAIARSLEIGIRFGRRPGQDGAIDGKEKGTRKCGLLEELAGCHQLIEPPSRRIKRPRRLRKPRRRGLLE